MALVIVAVVWTCSAGMAKADGDIAAGKTKADKCDTCHGGGKDAEGDDLAGMPMDKFIKAMNEYRSRERKHGGMRKRTSVLTDQDIQDLAAYYFSLQKK